MPNQQMLDFIKSEINKGIPKDQIKALLIQNGWLPSDVDSGFSALEMTPSIPQAPNNSQSTPIYQAPVINMKASGSKKKIMVGIITLIVVLVLGGAGAWAYFTYVYPDPQTTINKAFANLADQIDQKGIINGQSSFEIKGSGKLPQNPGGESTIDFNVSANALTDTKSQKASGDFSFNLALDVGPSMNINVDGQDSFSFIYSNNKGYIKFNKIPTGLEKYTSMFLKPAQLDFINNEIIGKWIEIDKDQTKTLAGLSNNASFITAMSSFGSNSNLDFKKMTSLTHAFADYDIFVLDKVLPGDTVNGQSVFHYRVKLDKTGLTNFALAAAKASNDGQYPEGISEQNIRDSIDKSFTQYENMSQSGINLTFDMYVGRFSKLPVKFTVNVDAGNFSLLKQISATVTATANATYDFPNSANIVEPTSFTTLTDLFMKIGIAFPASSSQSNVSMGGSNILSSSKVYVDKTNGFSILPPAGWVEDVSGSRNSLVSFKNKNGVIDVISSAATNDLSKYTDDYVNRLKSGYSDFVLTSKKATTVSGKNAYIVSGTFSFNSNKFRVNTLMVGGSNTFQIETQSTDSTWAKDGSSIINSLSSFKLNP